MCGLYMILISLLISIYSASAQCPPPTLVQVASATNSEISISWLYFGDEDGWEMELVRLGQSPTLNPTTPIIDERQYTFDDLAAATSYTIFIRTVCVDGSRSEWNPVSIRTHIPEPSPCLFTLPLKNNNCNQGLESFDIRVDGVEGQLGVDLFLSSVELILEHTWPADLDIRLSSPSGKEVVLSQNNGTVTDDYGDITGITCASTTMFSDLACEHIDDSRPPFIGSFVPETSLSLLEDETTANGIWKLLICDRSDQDVGFLKYIQLNFEPLLCETPPDILIKSIDANEVEVVWSAYDGCEVTTDIELSYHGDPPGTIRITQVPCNQLSVIIDNLEAGRDYDIYVLSNCSQGNASPLSCPFSFTTACTSVTLEESFDQMDICTAGCAFDCSLSGLWSNIEDIDDQDFIVWDRPTDTEDTGPRVGAFGGGSYIYMESSPDICSPQAIAVLNSECIEINSNAEECDMSFWYHMNGTDIGILALIINSNESNDWDTLFIASGDQGDMWHNTIVSLAAYNSTAAIFQFVGVTASGTRGDIAIDQIEFRGSQSQLGGYTYYQDLDQDGYGNEAFTLNICSTAPSPVFVTNSQDCDDNNDEINPEATEILCNSIDENCNGLDDDNPMGNPIEYTSEVTNDDCAQKGTGSIILEIVAGEPPFTYLWDNGSNTPDLMDIVAGTYQCVITDGEMCSMETEIFTVTEENNIGINISSMVAPSCFGQTDGNLTASAMGGMEPYMYTWSDGFMEAEHPNLAAGSYYVIANDSLGCLSDTFFVTLQADGAIEGDISFMLDIRCHGGGDGILRVDALSGVSPFSYIWETGEDTQQIGNLSSGNYTCTITDAQGCKAIVEAQMLEPTELISSIISQENVLCSGEHTGSIKTNIEGGKAPYSFAWSSGQATDDIFDLTAGDYQLTVTDANACTVVSEQVVISEPTLMEAVVDSALFAKCILSTNGYLSVQTVGGIPNYNYFWSSTDLDSFVLEDISPGIYSVTITDENNCKTTVNNFKLESEALPLEIILTTDGVNLCFNDQNVAIVASTSDAKAPIDYNWSSGNQTVTDHLSDTLTEVSAGRYTITVTDIEGCLGISDTLEIASGDPISVEILEKTNNTCHDDTVGILSVVGHGGASPYMYNWDSGQAGSVIDHLTTGNYIVTIIDNNGCTKVSQSISISSTPLFVIDAVIEPTHADMNIGSITLDILGGTPPYHIIWPDGIATEDNLEATELPAGEYNITISDVNECDTIFLAIVDLSNAVVDPSALDIEISPVPFSDILHLTSYDQVVTSYTIYNISGKKILTSQVLSPSRMTHIDTRSISAGVYFIAVRTPDVQAIFKVVKI